MYKERQRQESEGKKDIQKEYFSQTYAHLLNLFADGVPLDKVYDNKEWERAYVEDDYLDGYDPYSNSKSCSELVTHSYKRSFLDEAGFALSTARAGNVIGGGDFAHNRIVPDCFRAAKAKEALIIRNPSSIRPYQHVLDPLAIYLEILKAQLMVVLVIQN